MRVGLDVEDVVGNEGKGHSVNGDRLFKISKGVIGVL